MVRYMHLGRKGRRILASVACTIPTPAKPAPNATGATDLGSFPSATFRLTFDTGSYFEAIGTEAFYPGKFETRPQAQIRATAHNQVASQWCSFCTQIRIPIRCP